MPLTLKLNRGEWRYALARWLFSANRRRVPLGPLRGDHEQGKFYGPAVLVLEHDGQS
jgi:hypothetical protein